MTTSIKPKAAEVWWARPSRVLPLVATIIVLIALLTPQGSEGRFGDSRLTTNLAGSLNARVLADLSQRLGWRIVRDTDPSVIAQKGRAIHAVLAPPIPVTAAEAHQLLNAVRQGDAMLLTLSEKDALTDSLGVAQISRGYVLPEENERAEGCPRGIDLTPSLWPDGAVHLAPLRWLRGAPPNAISFANLKKLDRSGVPTIDAGTAAAGFSYGAGRIVVVSDPDLLRNDVIRKCRWGADVIAVRMLEWLRAGSAEPRNLLIFDEYHQGYGNHGSTVSVVMPFLFEHPVGRTVLVIALAGLVLLMAKAPRPIVPPTVEHIERRDPLEQVDALSHAYEQVRATRTVVALLVRGVRWRVQRSGPAQRTSSDTDFLDTSVARYPQLQGDVQLIKDALERSLPERELAAIGAALNRVEDTLTRPTS
jgi:hypothetical protein